MSLGERSTSALQRLKNDLRKAEQAARIAKVATDPIDRHLETLFARLALPNEGVEYDVDGKWIDAPLGIQDKLLFTTVCRHQSGEPRLAIGLPTVLEGVSTWLSVSFMAAQLYLARETHSSGAPQSILIASRHRNVRDLYLSQRLKFNRQPLAAARFPVFRIRPDGVPVPVAPGTPEPNSLSVPTFFYHFEDQKGWDRSKPTLALAEVFESDGRMSEVMLGRLAAVLSSNAKGRAIVFFNTFDRTTRQRLADAGYKLVDLKPAGGRSRPTRIPTIAAGFAEPGDQQRVECITVNDPGNVSRQFARAAAELVKSQSKAQSPDGRVITSRWWSLWRRMRNLAVPVSSYERYLVNVAGRRSLRESIVAVKYSASRLERFDSWELQEMAPTVSRCLLDIYDSLSQRNPKAVAMQQLIGDPSSDAPVIAFQERSQVEAFREELLFGNIPQEHRVGALTYLARSVDHTRGLAQKQLILDGAWWPWQEASVAGVGASLIRVLCYQSEAAALMVRLDAHRAFCSSLTPWGGAAGTVYPAILVAADDALLTTPPGRPFPDIDYSVALRIDEAPQDSEGGALEPDDDPVEEVTGPRFKILFVDGTLITAGASGELTKVTETGVESTRIDDLRPGDRVALIRDDAARSLFDAVLLRVAHLVRADPRVLERWRHSISRLRSLDTDGTFETSISAIRSKGCLRHDATIRSWLAGATMAPFDVHDIEIVLKAAGMHSANEMAPVVSREVQIVRTFNQVLGRRIRAHVTSALGGADGALDRLGIEIDEALEMVEYRVIKSIGRA